MSERELHESVADAIAAGDVVDWHDVQDAAATSRDADLIHQLRIIAAIGATRRVHAPRGPTRWSRTLEAVVAVVLTMALAQLTLAILGTPAAFARVAWPYIVNALIFGVGGVVLLAGGGRDRRLPLLGGLFLTISTAFGASLLPPPGVGLGGALTSVLHPLQPEAFLPLMLWRFVREFPVDTRRPRARRLASGFVDVSFGVGAVLFVRDQRHRRVWRFDDAGVVDLRSSSCSAATIRNGSIGRCSLPSRPPPCRFSFGRPGSRRTRPAAAWCSSSGRSGLA